MSVIIGSILGALAVVALVRLHLVAVPHGATWASEGPLTLEDDVVSIGAASSRGLPIQLPYAGKLKLEISVLKGQRVNAHLIRVTDWKAFAKANGKAIGKPFPFAHPDFQATGITRATLSGYLFGGAYFVLLENPTIQENSSPFEVKLQATLSP